MKLDPGIHVAMHSVLSLKLGVTEREAWEHSAAHGMTRVTVQREAWEHSVAHGMTRVPGER